MPQKSHGRVLESMVMVIIRDFEVSYSVLFHPFRSHIPSLIGTLNLQGNPEDREMILFSIARRVPLDWKNTLGVNYAIKGEFTNISGDPFQKWRSSGATPEEMVQFSSQAENKQSF